MINFLNTAVSPMEQYNIYSIMSWVLSINNVNFYQIQGGQIPVLITQQGSIWKQIPNNMTIFTESQFRTLLLMVDNFVGRSKLIYLPQIFTVFHTILFSNQVGMIPYSSTPTVEIVMTQSLSFTQLIGVQLQGVLTHGPTVQASFLPAGTPDFLVFPMILQEILAYLTRTLSLGLRLAVNMITGHILVKVSVGFLWVAYKNGISFLFLTIPILLLVQFQSLEQLIAYLQAYIFTFITCQTFKDMS